MRIVSRDELAKMPNGTVFSLFTGHDVNGFEIIIGSDGNGFNGTLNLEPSFNWDKDDAERVTNWSSVDTADYDFNDDEKFAVYSKNEIREIIAWLKWAIDEGEHPDMWKYFYKDQALSVEQASKYTDGYGLWYG
jgi:hypothetical protein